MGGGGFAKSDSDSFRLRLPCLFVMKEHMKRL